MARRAGNLDTKVNSKARVQDRLDLPARVPAASKWWWVDVLTDYCRPNTPFRLSLSFSVFTFGGNAGPAFGDDLLDPAVLVAPRPGSTAGFLLPAGRRYCLCGKNITNVSWVR